ncbi:VanZ family protein [Paenibacillus beijingensis]|uniref:VanZ-like domain-containing protein n=1 Tax=Paenibacillus beijingensis TaxID=1126833 RepID=A0A0D5NFD2_9BACL|nr:VanZ family protein [Paenibacillus beijingensis]AJY73966.1 hypothetical protein VN24_04235 [Paenibacillus beijingensis]
MRQRRKRRSSRSRSALFSLGWLRIVIPILWLAWIAVIFIFSSQSYQKQSIQPLLHRTLTAQGADKVLPKVDFSYDHRKYSSDSNPFGMIEFLFRKGAHLFVYGMLAILTAMLMARFRIRGASLAAFPLLTAGVVAVLDEMNQGHSPSRTPAYQDVFVDLTGASLGLLLYFFVRLMSRRYKSSSRHID